MSLFFIYTNMEELKTGWCKNPWCKATFNYKGDHIPDQCWKCQSFESMSGGITWTEKKYDGPRFDGLPHQISINVSRSTDRKKY